MNHLYGWDLNLHFPSPNRRLILALASPHTGYIYQAVLHPRMRSLPSGKLSHNELERSTMLWMEKLTNFRLGHGFQFANCWHNQRVSPYIPHDFPIKPYKTTKNSYFMLFWHNQMRSLSIPSHPEPTSPRCPLWSILCFRMFLVMFIRSLPNLRRREWLRWFGETPITGGKTQLGIHHLSDRNEKT